MTPEHEAEMVADDTSLHIPLKRSHLPSRGSEPELEARLLNGSGSGAGQRPALDVSTGRRPKRPKFPHSLILLPFWIMQPSMQPSSKVALLGDLDDHRAC